MLPHFQTPLLSSPPTPYSAPFFFLFLLAHNISFLFSHSENLKFQAGRGGLAEQEPTQCPFLSSGTLQGNFFFSGSKTKRDSEKEGIHRRTPTHYLLPPSGTAWAYYTGGILKNEAKPGTRDMQGTSPHHLLTEPQGPSVASNIAC